MCSSQHEKAFPGYSIAGNELIITSLSTLCRRCAIINGRAAGVPSLIEIWV
jgi:hypothetical protein